MQTLPSPPDLPTLSNDDFSRLKAAHPDLWSDPFDGNCITCRGKKQFRARVLNNVVEYECDCLDQWRVHTHLLNAGIGLAYQQVSWGDVDPQVPPDVIEAILSFVENADAYVHNGFGLILHGKNGTGKTLLVTLLLKALLRKGYDGYFTQFNEMLDSYTKGWRDPAEEAWFIRRVCNARVLVVDDIGKESKGRENVTTSMFDRVIRSRGENNLATIITTNYTMEEIQAGYGGSVMSLLSANCDGIEVTGADYRPKVNLRKKADILEGLARPVVFE